MRNNKEGLNNGRIDSLSPEEKGDLADLVEGFKKDPTEKLKRRIPKAIEGLGQLTKQERINSKTQEIFNKTYDFLKEYGQNKNTFYKVLTPGVEFWKYFEDKIDDYELYLSSPHEDSIEKSLEKENCEIKLRIGDAKEQDGIKKELYPIMAISIEAKKISIWRPEQRFESAKDEKADEMDLLKVEEIIDGLINKKHFDMAKAKGAGDTSASSFFNWPGEK